MVEPVIWSALSHAFPHNGTYEASVFRTRYKSSFRWVACVVGSASSRGKLELGGNAFLALTKLEQKSRSIRRVALESYWGVPLLMSEAFRLSEQNDALLMLGADEALYAQAYSLLNAHFSADDLRHFVWKEPVIAPLTETREVMEDIIPSREVSLEMLRAGGPRRAR